MARPPAVAWAPALLIAALLLIAPVYLALRTLGAGPEAADLIFRARILEVLLRTVALMGAVMVGCVVIAAPLAWLTVRTDLPFRGFWRVVTMLPLALPSYIVGFAVVVSLGPVGFLQEWLELRFGVERLPSIYGFPGAAFTLVFLSFPYVLLPIRAALWNMDVTLEESARALGRSRWQTFHSVTLPMLRPAILAGGLLAALYTLSDFGAVAMMRYETFTWSIFIAYDTFSRDLAAAWSLVLIVLALVVVWGENMARNAGSGRYYRSQGGASRLAEPIPLGAWRWPALAYCGFISLVSLGLPVAVLAYWTVRGVAAGEPLLLLWKAAANSVGVAALAAALTVICAAPVAMLAVRYPGVFSRWLERLGFVGFALPGIVIALALIFFATRHMLILYQTLPFLLLGYAIRFLPLSIGATRGALAGVNPRLEEAARGLGLRPAAVIWRITVPLARAGILAGMTLVFMNVIKESPATLLLSPTGFQTYATYIWNSYDEAIYSQIARPGLILIILCALCLAPIFLLEKQRRAANHYD